MGGWRRRCHWPRWRTVLRGESGQTATEYLMIVGILTAIIIALSKMIVPAIAYGILAWLDHVVVYVSSV